MWRYRRAGLFCTVVIQRGCGSALLSQRSSATLPLHAPSGTTNDAKDGEIAADEGPPSPTQHSLTASFESLQGSLLSLVHEHRRTGSQAIIEFANSQVCDFSTKIESHLSSSSAGAQPETPPILEMSTESVQKVAGTSSDEIYRQLTPPSACSLLRSCAYIEARTPAAPLESVERNRFCSIVSILLKYIESNASMMSVREVGHLFAALDMLHSHSHATPATLALAAVSKSHTSYFDAVDSLHVLRTICRICPEFFSENEPFFSALLARIVALKGEYRLGDLCRILSLVYANSSSAMCRETVSEMFEPLSLQMRAARLEHIIQILPVLMGCVDSAMKEVADRGRASLLKADDRPSQSAQSSERQRDAPHEHASGSGGKDESEDTQNARQEPKQDSTRVEDRNAEVAAADADGGVRQVEVDPLQATPSDSSPPQHRQQKEGNVSEEPMEQAAPQAAPKKAAPEVFHLPTTLKVAISSRYKILDKRQFVTPSKQAEGAQTPSERSVRDQRIDGIYEVLPLFVALDMRLAAEVAIRRLTALVPTMDKSAWLRCLAFFHSSEKLGPFLSNASLGDLRSLAIALHMQLQRRLPQLISDLAMEEFLHVQNIFVGSNVLMTEPVQRHILDLFESNKDISLQQVLQIFLGQTSITPSRHNRENGISQRIVVAAGERIQHSLSSISLHDLCQVYCARAVGIHDFVEVLSHGLSQLEGWDDIPLGLRSAALTTSRLMYRHQGSSDLAKQLCLIMSLLSVLHFFDDDVNVDVVMSHSEKKGSISEAVAERTQTIRTRFLAVHALTVLALHYDVLTGPGDERLVHIRNVLLKRFEQRAGEFQLSQKTPDGGGIVKFQLAHLFSLTIRGLIEDLPPSSPILCSHLLTWYSCVAPMMQDADAPKPLDAAIEKLVNDCMIHGSKQKREIFLRCVTSLHRLDLLNAFSRQLSLLASKLTGAISTGADGAFLVQLFASCLVSSPQFNQVISQLAPSAADFRMDYSESDLMIIMSAFGVAVSNCRTAAVTVASEVVRISRSCALPLLTKTMQTLSRVDASQTVQFKQLAAMAVYRQNEFSVEDAAQCLASFKHWMSPIAAEFRPQVLHYLKEHEDYEKMPRSQQEAVLHDTLVLLPALTKAFAGDAAIWNRVAEIVSGELKDAEAAEDLATICTLKRIVEPCFLDAGSGARLPKSLRTAPKSTAEN